MSQECQFYTLGGSEDVLLQNKTAESREVSATDRRSKRNVHKNGRGSQGRRTREAPQTRGENTAAYQGFQHDHPNTAKPVKKTKRHPLTKEEKRANREQARERIVVENVIGSIKRFRILADRYRSRRKRFGLRINLIAAIYNWEIDHVNDVQG